LTVYILWALSHDLEVLYLGWCFHGDSFVCILTLFFSSYATSGWDFVFLMLGWVYKSRLDCTLEYLLIQLWMDVRTVIFYVRASNWTCPVLAYIHCFELMKSLRVTAACPCLTQWSSGSLWTTVRKVKMALSSAVFGLGVTWTSAHLKFLLTFFLQLYSNPVVYWGFLCRNLLAARPKLLSQMNLT